VKPVVKTLLLLFLLPYFANAQTMGDQSTMPTIPSQAGGTVVVVMALSDGIVLAADSRLTINYPTLNPNYKIGSDSNAKLFDIGQIAIATYDTAFLTGRSIGSIVADFDKDKRDKVSDVEDVAKRFAQYIKPIYDTNTQQAKAEQSIGFIVAGYNHAGIGELYEISLPKSPDPVKLQQTTRENQGIIWRGQTDVIQRLVMGYDPRLGLLPTWAKLDDPAKEGFKKELSELQYYIPYQFLLLQDGIDLSLALVQVTVDMQRFSFGTIGSQGSIPGIGGAVDVLVIDPYKLSWIKRKTLSAK
jgi:hypothetical protein